LGENAEVDALRTELAAANREIARLQELLGLAPSEDREPSSWEGTLFSETGRLPTVDEASPNVEKLALLRALFAGREDVYAVRWENARSGRAGWSPAVRGGWARARQRSRPECLPLTDDVLVGHLRGEQAIGIYPLLIRDACRLLACDFDARSWALDALAYVDACRAADVPVALERSRSGDGAHAWVFFAEPVPASTARSIGAGLLRRAMAARVEIGLASYDRLFPSQDFMPKGSFGNLIALPLEGASRRQGNTVFLDPASLEPWADQWAFLSAVGRMSAEAAAAAAQALGGLELGPDRRGWRQLIEAPGPKPPARVRARAGGQFSIERSGLPPAVIAGLKHLASLHNPVFYEKQKMRFSTWNTPRIVRCYEEDLDRIHLPRGLAAEAAELFEAAGSRLDVVDARPEHQRGRFEFRSQLDPVQARAVDELCRHDLGVLVAPPGTGKTVMACALIAHHAVPTLVLCDRRELVEQWRARLSEHLGLASAEVGLTGGARSRPTHVVDIATIQSLARQEEPERTFDGYGLVVVDECHHVPAVSFEACVRHATVRRWLGLTATPYRRDGLEGILTMQLGPIRHEIAVSSTPAASMHRELVVHETPVEPLAGEDFGIQDVLRTVAEDEDRNALVCADIEAAAFDGRNCLVLTQRTDHIERLVARMEGHGLEPLVLRGGTGKKARAAVREAIETPDCRGVVLVATASYLGEGFDWPALDALFLAFPLAWRGRVVQYVGRLLRAHDGKHHVEVHDYVDTRVPVLARMHEKRLAGYAALGFDVRPARRRARSHARRSPDLSVGR
jgi:superfamily II DNA or RNA helicase